MPTIYLDVLLLQSLYVNYFLLRAAAKLTHTPLGWLRCGLAAAGSSLFSLLILLPPLPVLLQLLLKLLAAAAAVVLAFGLHRESFFRQCGCFFLCNFLLAGLILAVDSLTPRGFAAWGNSCCYLNFSLFQLVLFTAAAYSLLHICTLLRRRHRHTDDRFQVFFRLGSRQLVLDGLADTGNNLTDTFSGTPVIVCSAAALAPLLDGTPPEQLKGYRLIPCATITAQGLLPLFRPDEVLYHRKKPPGGCHGRHRRNATERHLSPTTTRMKGVLFMQPILRKFRLLLSQLRGKFSPLCRVDYINGSDTFPPPLSKEEEQAVFARLHQGDTAARETLIVHNLRLVVYIAKKFESSGLGLEDLISIGTIGLIKAVETFCPDKKIKLATYASRCIENEILMVLRKNAQLRGEISIDEPLSSDWDGNELLLSDILGTDEDIVSRDIENEAEREMLLAAVSELGEREQEIMQMRFGLCGKKERTQKEVAEAIGISQSYISRLEKKIIRKLRKKLEEADQPSVHTT